MWLWKSTFFFIFHSEPLPSPEPIQKPQQPPSKPTSRADVKPDSPEVEVHHAGPDDQVQDAKLDPRSRENMDDSQCKQHPEPQPPSDLQSPPPTVKRRRVMGPFLPPSSAKHRAKKSQQKVSFSLVAALF